MIQSDLLIHAFTNYIQRKAHSVHTLLICVTCLRMSHVRTYNVAWYVTIYECSNLYLLYNIDFAPYTMTCNRSQKIIIYTYTHTYINVHHIYGVFTYCVPGDRVDSAVFPYCLPILKACFPRLCTLPTTLPHSDRTDIAVCPQLLPIHQTCFPQYVVRSNVP